MKQTKLILLLAVAFSLCFCAGRKKTSNKGYTIAGTIKGAEDGTWVYLKNADKYNSEPLNDSTQVRKGRFKFSGQLQDKVLLTMIGLKGPVYAADGTVKEYKLIDADVLWLENNSIMFDGEKGSLTKAAVAGSATQQDWERYNLGINAGSEIFIKQNPDSYLSAFLLNAYKQTWDKTLVIELYNTLSANSKATVYGRQVAAHLGLAKE